MTLEGLGGPEIEGKFKSGICCDECHFSGLKISPSPFSAMPDPSDEWSSRNEHEHARIARWH